MSTAPSFDSFHHLGSPYGYYHRIDTVTSRRIMTSPRCIMSSPHRDDNVFVGMLDHTASPFRSRPFLLMNDDDVFNCSFNLSTSSSSPSSDFHTFTPLYYPSSSTYYPNSSTTSGSCSTLYDTTQSEHEEDLHLAHLHQLKSTPYPGLRNKVQLFRAERDYSSIKLVEYEREPRVMLYSDQKTHKTSLVRGARSSVDTSFVYSADILPPKRQTHYQVCDIKDSRCQAVLRNYETSVFTVEDGFYTMGHADAVRKVMAEHVSVLIRKQSEKNHGGEEVEME
eukprot:sb/3467892/